jgi:long-chain fatty acid transport protein
MSSRAPLFSLVLALAAPSAARANPWDLYGFNARAVGMAGAHTAFADDFTAVWYNPAALTAARDSSFGFGYFAGLPRLSIAFDRAERAVEEARAGRSDGVSFGALFPLGGSAFRDRLAFGLAINVPTQSVLNGQALDSAVPQWLLYQSLPRRLVAALGLGATPVEWLSLGLGFQLLAGLDGRLDYELDAVAGRFVQKNVTFDIRPKVSPLLGVELRPARGLRLGAAYRGSIATTVALPVALSVTGLADIDVATRFQVQYTPQQLSLGASYDLGEPGLALAVDLTWARWSRAPDPSVSSRLEVRGPLLDGTGLAGALDAPAPGQERLVDLGLRDVLRLRAGLEQRLGPFALRAGYGLRPSPAPLQTSGTNYLDGTAHEVSVGVGVRLQDPLGALANPVLLDLAGAGLFLPARRHEKLDSRDAVGSYSAGGAVWVVALSFRYAFGEAPATAPAAPPLVVPLPDRRP